MYCSFTIVNVHKSRLTGRTHKKERTAIWILVGKSLRKRWFWSPGNRWKEAIEWILVKYEKICIRLIFPRMAFVNISVIIRFIISGSISVSCSTFQGRLQCERRYIFIMNLLWQFIWWYVFKQCIARLLTLWNRDLNFNNPPSRVTFFLLGV